MSKTPEEQAAYWRKHALWLEDQLNAATKRTETAEQQVEAFRHLWDIIYVSYPDYDEYADAVDRCYKTGALKR